MWLENKSALNYQITVDYVGETVLTFSSVDNQTASINIKVVLRGAISVITFTNVSGVCFVMYDKII